TPSLHAAQVPDGRRSSGPPGGAKREYSPDRRVDERPDAPVRRAQAFEASELVLGRPPERSQRKRVQGDVGRIPGRLPREVVGRARRTTAGRGECERRPGGERRI